MARFVVSVLVTIAVALIAAQSTFAHDSGFGLARYTPDGRLDSTFGNNGIVVTRSAQSSFVANALAIQPDGKIVIGGMVSDIASGSLELGVARYDSDGAPDATFGTDGMVSTPVGAAGAEATAITIQRNGMILVAGTAFAQNGAGDQALLARYTSAGALDSSFGIAGITTTQLGSGASSAAGVAIQSDDHIIVVGTAYANGATDDDFGIAAYMPSGKLDQSFGNGGIVNTDFGASGARPSVDHATSVALQPDGKLVVAGFTRGERPSFAAARYTRAGNLDPTFGTNGKALVPAAEPQVFAVVLQSYGDVVLAGSTTIQNGTAPFALVRLLPNGLPDELFGTGGISTTSFDGSRSGARAVVAQPDGDLITGGARFGAPSAQGDALPQSGFALARYKADGNLDLTFGDNGRALTDLGDAGATPLSLAIQSDGKILAAGLVFFQVQTQAPSTAQDLHDLMLAGLGFAALIVVVVMNQVRRRRR